MWAAENGAQVNLVHTGTLKLWATGHGKATKDQMIAAANRLGCDTKNDNIADAFLLLKYTEDQIGKHI